MAYLARKQQVNQLRKAHFPFGFEASKGRISEYRHKYPEYQLGNVEHVGANRTNNFSLDNGTGTPLPLSQFKDCYPSYELSAVNRSAANKHGDGNIVLGYEKNDLATNYADHYSRKLGECERVKPIDQRKTNVDFGDALSNFTTTYKYQYDAKQVDPQRKAADTSHASNLMFGNNSPEYVTSHGESYVPIVAPVQQAGKRNYLNNIEFGTGDNGYISEKQHQYAAKPMEQREVVAKETIQDFRSAHFQFGFGQLPPNISEAQTHFTQKPLQGVKADVNKRQTNIKLSVDQNTDYSSTYAQGYKNKTGQRAKMSVRQDNGNVLLGCDGMGGYLTEAKQQFGKKEGVGQRAKMIRPTGNLTLGDGGHNYITHNQTVYTEKSLKGIGRANALQSGNIVNGFHDVDYQLSSNEYGSKQGESNKLPKEVLAGMKNTNIVHDGGKSFEGDTTYHVEYGWKTGER